MLAPPSLPHLNEAEQLIRQAADVLIRQYQQSASPEAAWLAAMNVLHMTLEIVADEHGMAPDEEVNYVRKAHR